MNEPDPDPDCHKCRQYFVTFDAAHPHGCRAFDFKAKQLPAQLVRQNSSEPCRAFEQRPSPARP